MVNLHLVKSGQCAHREVKDMSNSFGLPKADVGRLFAGRGEAVQRVRLPHHLRRVGSFASTDGAFRCIACGITFHSVAA